MRLSQCTFLSNLPVLIPAVLLGLLLFTALSNPCLAVDNETQVYISLPPDPVTGMMSSATATIVPEPPVTNADVSRATRRFAPDIVIQPPEWSANKYYVWKIVFLLYPSIDMTQVVSGVTSHFTYTMTSSEIVDARLAMDSAVQGIRIGSNNEAKPLLTTVIVGRTLTSLAKFGADIYWPDCSITSPELITYAQGVMDSAIVYWPSTNSTTSQHVNNPYWGLSYGTPQSWTYGVGYSTIANIISPNHPAYYPGEVFIHEWLHPTSDFYYQVKGYAVPNLDGAGNYKPCSTCANYTSNYGDGWMSFYRDLMRGTVWDPASSSWKGITPSAWQSGTPTNTMMTDCRLFDE